MMNFTRCVPAILLVLAAAETADGYDDLVRVVRSQIGRNIDFVKVYADYRWRSGKRYFRSAQVEPGDEGRRDLPPVTGAGT